MSEIVGRRTVPQVFINGKHLGGSDGILYLNVQLVINCPIIHFFYNELLVADTVEAYENGELVKLLGIATTEEEDL